MIHTARLANRLIGALLPDPARLGRELDRVENALAHSNEPLAADAAEDLDLLAAVVERLRELVPQLECGDPAAEAGLSVSLRMLKHLGAAGSINRGRRSETPVSHHFRRPVPCI